MGCGCKKNKQTTTTTNTTQTPSQQDSQVKISLTEDLQKQVDQIVETIKKIS